MRNRNFREFSLFIADFKRGNCPSAQCASAANSVDSDSDISNGRSVSVNPLNAELNPICHLLVLLGDLTAMGPCIVSIFQYSYIQQDATLHSLFISENCSTCFGWYFHHPSSGAHTTVSTASGFCHTVTATCRYRGRVGTGLTVLWVAYATHSTLRSSLYSPH
jgi:hypothetical protein